MCATANCSGAEKRLSTRPGGRGTGDGWGLLGGVPPLRGVTPATRCYSGYAVLLPLRGVTPATRCYSRYAVLPPLRGATQAVFGDLAAQRIAVHSEQVRGLSQVAVGPAQHVRDELLL